VEDVRSARRQLAGFSAELAAEERELKQFLYRKLYNAPLLVPVREQAQRVISNLFKAYRTDAALLPASWRNDGTETDRVRAIGDFIAGMTDRFAIARHEELVGPVDLPDRF
jgi:dGTPase